MRKATLGRPRLFPRQRLAPVTLQVGHTPLPGLLLVWVASYLALLLLNTWLLEVRGVLSGELVWLETQRRLLVVISPSHLGALIQSETPLLVLLTILSGSAIRTAALVGASAITLLAQHLWRMDVPRIWLLLILANPALVLVLLQSPLSGARALVLVLALNFLWQYLRAGATYQVLVVAFALATLMLIDQAAWPVLLLLGGVLLLQRRPRREYLTVLLVTFFPAVFLLLSWRYLEWVQGSTISLPLAFPVMSVGDVATTTLPLIVVLLPVLVAVVLSLVDGQPEMPDTARRAAVVLLSGVLIDPFLRVVLGQAAMLHAATVALLALPLVMSTLRHSRFANALVGSLLVITLLLGWPQVAQQHDEAALLLARTTGQPVALPDEPLRTIARVLNAKASGQQRVLLVGGALTPLVGLVDQPGRLILSHQRSYTVVLQAPERWADLVVVADTQPQTDGFPTNPQATQHRLGQYTLVLHTGEFALYQRNPAVP